MSVYPPQLRLALSLLCILLGVHVPAGRAALDQPGQKPDSPGAGQAPPLVLELPPEPLIPRQPRTELQQDRLDAVSLFAAARTHQHQQQYAQALRLYQRALRCDPESLALVRAIIPLALRLKREAQVERYVLKAGELEIDPRRLQGLGDYLFKRDNHSGALRLYEKAIAATGGSGEKTVDDVRLLMMGARLYLQAGQHAKAADCFAQVAYALDHPQEYGLDDRAQRRFLGDPGLTYRLFGESYLLAGRLDEAAAAFEKAHQLAPDQGRLEFNRARILARREKPQQALAALEACFKHGLASEGSAPLALLAEVLDDLGRQGELIQRLEKLRAEDPKNVPLAFFLAEQYHQAGQLQKAEPLYAELAHEDPTLALYRHLPEIYRRLAEIYRKTRRPDALLALLGNVVETIGLLDMLGPQLKAITTDAEMMQKVVETARARAQSEPEQLNYHTRSAVALLALEAKQYDTAAEFFELALKAKPDQAAEVLRVWGLALVLEERPAEAAKVFRRAIDGRALRKDRPRFYDLLAGALAMDGKTDEALAAARTGLAEKPEDPRLQSRVAWILYRARRRDEAIEAYRSLIDKSDSDYRHDETREVLREARLVLSSLYVLKDDFVEAEEWLQQVLDEFPDDVGASNDLGYLWADEGIHLNRALKMIQHAVKAEPDNAAYLDSLGWVFYRLGRHQEAVTELQRAVAAEGEPDPVILDHLGDAHLKASKPQEAKQAWLQAVEAFKKREEPQKAEKVQQKILANQ